MRIKLVETSLTEGTHYDKKAVQKIVESGLFDEDTATKIIDGLFKEDIHAFVHSPAWLEKYLVGIANMLIKYCKGDKTKAESFLTNSINTFEQYLTYVKDIRPKLSKTEQLQLDDDFINNMSYQDLERKLDEIVSRREKESEDELKNKSFNDVSNYELIKIDSFEQFNKLFGGEVTGDGSSDKYAGGGGTAWCHANSKSTYDSWVKDDRFQFFVLANKNWRNIPFNPATNAENPKDDYGNSLIALLVSKSGGRIKNATLRCNHVGVNSNADSQYNTYAELSNIAGFNVQAKIYDLLNIDPSDILEYNQKLWEKYFDGTAESVEKIIDLLDVERSSLTYAFIPSDAINIGDYAFRGCSGLTSVVIEEGVTSIGDRAFYYCRSLTSITIPSSVTSIGECAFEGCESLKSIDIPSSVTSIGDWAFYCCESLTSITLPSSVTSIGDYAFCNCSGLASITLPSSVTSIGKYAFFNSGLTSVTIPDSVMSISVYAFSDCPELTSVTIPDGVTIIGAGTFSHCGRLISTVLPLGITSIRNSLFEDCYSLPSITIPSSVISIERRAFSECHQLTSVTIPSSVTTIGESAFAGCPNLKDVYYAGTMWQWDRLNISGHNGKLLSANIHFSS